MAIAFDAGTDGGYFATMNGSTFNHTVTGSNPILFVATFGNAGGADTVTGVTYNGVAMTRVNGVSNGAARFSTMWMLPGCATGTNTVALSASVGDGGAVAVSYTGAAQSGQPDANKTGAVLAASFDVSNSTVADNCWVVLGGRAEDSPGNITAHAGSTMRVNSSGGLPFVDSNAAITPAGTKSLGWSSSNANGNSGVWVSFSPFTGGGGGVAPTPRRRTLVGVGQ